MSEKNSIRLTYVVMGFLFTALLTICWGIYTDSHAARIDLQNQVMDLRENKASIITDLIYIKNTVEKLGGKQDETDKKIERVISLLLKHTSQTK
jgi:peptidoglycan hydrolase CwlO-like protein